MRKYCNHNSPESVIHMDEAAKDAREIKDDNVPPWVKNAVHGSEEDKKQAAKYKYPHSYGGWVKQQYLPDEIKDAVFYEPTENGFEKVVKERQEKRK